MSTITPEKIKDIQSKLNAWMDANLKTDGVNGPKTIKAASDFAEWMASAQTEIQAVKYHETPTKLNVKKLASDADGCPRAYGPNGLGLDYLANAGSKGDWWGIATDSKGNPFIQTINDTAPGYYVSTTSLQDSSFPINDPRRYVDASVIPGCVLPNSTAKSNGIRLGDLILLERPSNGKSVWTIFFDVGPAVGEASMTAVQALGGNPDPKNGGVPDSVTLTMYPKSGTGKILTADQIIARAKELGLA